MLSENNNTRKLTKIIFPKRDEHKIPLNLFSNKNHDICIFQITVGKDETNYKMGTKCLNDFRSANLRSKINRETSTGNT